MATIDVVMPKMGESVIEGTVLTWHKAPGDAVSLDETLLEIGTDKVDSDIPAPASGKLSEVLVEEGATVEVGTVLARINTGEENGEQIADDAAQTGSGTVEQQPEESGAEAEAAEPVAEEEPATEPEPEGAAPGDTGMVVDVVMPKMGESVIEGTVLTWHKKPGDKVSLDETVLEIGTDKVDSDIPAPAPGVLLEILVEEGETVEVGTVLARIGEAGAKPETASAPEAPSPAKKPAPKSAEKSSDAGEAPKRRGSDGRFYSPLVRSIASEEGVSQAELESIEGSGKEGRVTKKDILAYLEERKAVPPPKPAARRPAARERETPPVSTSGDDRVEIVPMDRMRQIIAEHMVRSKATSAHVTSFAEADVTNLVKLRERRKKLFLEREGVKLTYTPFFVRAAVDALRAHPWLNASVEGTNILVRKDFHIGIAVAVGQMGLVVPVIRDAGSKNLVGLAKTAADLAEKARNKRLEPDELSGGTFTVTNVGSLGSIIGTPIINQPQVAILATGTIRKQPVVIEDEALGDVIGIRSMMMLSLTYDHRIIDGAMAASFMQTVVKSLEEVEPDNDLLG